MKSILKKSVLALSVAALLTTGAFASRWTNLRTVNKYTCNVRPALCVVSEVSGDTITMIDCNGNVWEACGYEDLLPGDYVAVAFSDNGTDIIYDDVILSVWYQRPDLLPVVESNELPQG